MCLDLAQLDPADIPPAERFGWQPVGLVAVLGTHAWRHWSPVSNVAFDSGGRVVSVGSDGLRVWSFGDRSGLPTEEAWCPDIRPPVAFSRDGRVVATATELSRGDVEIRVLDLNGEEPTQVCERSVDRPRRSDRSFRPDLYLAVSADGEFVALVPNEECVQLMRVSGDRLENGPRLYPPAGDWDYLCYPAFSPDDRLLAVGTGNGNVLLAELQGPLPRLRADTSIRVTNWVAALRFGSSTALLAATGSEDLRLFGLESTTVFAEWLTVVNGTGLAFSPDGHLLALSDTGTDEGNRVILFDLSGPVPREAGEIESGEVQTWGGDLPAAFSPDGRTLAVGTHDGRVMVWDLPTDEDEELDALDALEDDEPGGGGDDDPDGDEGGEDQTPTRSWRLRNPAQGHLHGVGQIAFSPDGTQLLTRACDCAGEPVAGKEAALLWRFGPGCAALSPERVGRDDPRLVGWGSDSSPGTEHQPGVLAVSPAGDIRLTAADAGRGLLQAVRVADGRVLWSWPPPGRVFGAAFAPDGRHFALGNANGTAYIVRLPLDEPGDATEANGAG